MGRTIPMAARKEITQRKAALLQDLRGAYQSGKIVPGEPAPSVRDLAREYELSVGVAAQQMQVLVQEGLFHTVAGMGTFVGQSPARDARLFLYLLSGSVWEQQLKSGFEDEVTRHGCATLVLSMDQTVASLRAGTLPPVAGLFGFGCPLTEEVAELLNSGRSNPVPLVYYVDRIDEYTDADRLLFDNYRGSYQATQHLLAAGHRRVAFLGVHAEDDFIGNEWSVSRLEGWQAAMERRGAETSGLTYLPRRAAPHSVADSSLLLLEAALRLLQDSDANAVVAANDRAAQQLILACRQLRIPHSRWPAIVSFDDTLSEHSQMITSLRLPWDELGRTAASLLWERSQGTLVGPSICRQLPMRLVTRLTCRANWSFMESPLGAA